MKNNYIILLLFSFIIANTLDENNSIGYCIKNISNVACKDINQQGINFIRTGTTWRNIEKEKGIYNWTRLDSIVEISKANNLQILLLIGFGNPIYLDNKLHSEDVIANSRIITSKIFRPYKKFLEKLINRYKEDINHFEVWNEPDLENYWNGSKDNYIRLLKLSYKTIKRIHPHATILNGGISGKNMIEWYELLITKCPDCFDIFNFHLYKHCNKKRGFYNDYIEGIKQISQLSTKRLWLTETGLTNKQIAPKTCGGYNETIQTHEIIRRLLINKHFDIEKTFIFCYDNRCKINGEKKCHEGYAKNKYFNSPEIRQLVQDINKYDITMIDYANFKLSNNRLVQILDNEIIYN